MDWSNANRAERRIGELMQAQRETVGLRGPEHFRGGGSSGSSRDPLPEAPPTLADAGIDKHLADRARKLAAVDRDTFESELSDWRDGLGGYRDLAAIVGEG